ncbi:MAG: acyl-CoA dehydrogenase family protein [Actinobacteria bacterium]|nr:acyl-CoA dehydrogenase family protein [Actinomycetota bacterium]MBU1492851.1 acyl-CoA dehydrogenase family protein [Actinomycetota bacterium]
MPYATHEVVNQPPPRMGYNVFTGDPALPAAVAREGAGWAAGDLTELGALAGTEEALEWGRLANENQPVLLTHDRFGHRLDRIDYHPAYHRLMATAVAAGMHGYPWAEAIPGSHVARAAKMIVWSQAETGHICPISMTYSVVAALRHQPDLAAVWEPGLTVRSYDPAYAPSLEKTGLTAGMALTEKQGGSDVRANTTVAVPDGAGAYSLTGHKWFVSAPMSDVFLVLANAPGGLSCFLLPRWLPDGTRNPFAVQRLKDKMGDKANASSEVELDGSLAWMVGEEGRGVRTIVEMINRTRLDCSLGSAAGMRQALAEAIHNARHRDAFGARLSDQPVMLGVLADLALESEAATLAAMRLAGAYDRDEAFARIGTPVVKFWVCKRQPGMVAEALECLGGSGYVEESVMPRLFRQSPLNGVWEGSGNVIALDMLRAMQRTPESVDGFVEELQAAAGSDARYDAALAGLIEMLEAAAEPDARRLAGRMAVLLEASLMLRHAPEFVAEAFIASRIVEPAPVYGVLPGGVDAAAIVDRALPA